MNKLKCKIGYIYCLMIDNKPFYIGQTKNTIKGRLRFHYYSTFVEKSNSYLYKYIRSISDEGDFYDKIKIKAIMTSKISDLRYNEVKCIKYCINKNLKIYNSCVVTNTLLNDKYNKINT